MVKVSIIIINYNTFQLTCNCIQSIIDKTVDVDYEIILVDNASTECNPAEFIEQFPNIKLLKTSENIGFAKGNNFGITYSNGEYILLLNSDTELTDNSIKTGLDYFLSDNNTGVITGKLIYPNGEIQHNCQRFPSLKYKLLEKLRLHKFLSKKSRGKLLFGPYFSYDEIAKPDWVWGTFFMFKKNILNLFPERKLHDNFFMYIEDMQWCFYIKNYLKKDIVFIPKICITHVCGGSNDSPNDFLVKNYNFFLATIHSKFYNYILNKL